MITNHTIKMKVRIMDLLDQIVNEHDAITKQGMSALEILTSARALIASPDNWTQYGMARTALNEFVEIDDSEACKFCAVGAVYKNGHDNFELECESLEALASVLHPDELDDDWDHWDHEEIITSYNDAFSHASVVEISAELRPR